MSDFFTWVKEQLPQAGGGPRYIQLATVLESAIRQRILSSGDFLPPERNMAEVLAFSRVTISKAMSLLEEKNLVTRHQGSGTRVCQYIEYPLNKERGFTAQVLRSGGEVSNHWLQRVRQPVPATVAVLLNVPPESSVSKLRRVRVLNGKPVSLETTYIPAHFLPQPEQLEHSLYAFWETCGIYPENKTFRLKAIACSEEVAGLLEIQPNTPLLRISQLSMNKQGEVLEFSESLCRSDIYEFEVAG